MSVESALEVLALAAALVGGGALLWSARRASLPSSVKQVGVLLGIMAVLHTCDALEWAGVGGADAIGDNLSILAPAMWMVITFTRSREQVDATLRATQADSAAKSLFLGGMSHELRTPLNAILGYAQLLQRQPQLPAEHRRAADGIVDAGSNLLAIIEDVLATSRIESGSLRPRLAPCELRTLMDRIAEQLRPVAVAKGLAFAVTVDPEVPPWVETDEGKLRQMVVNLVGNALKFTASGGVRVAVSAGIRIAVTDTGPGIGPDEGARLFEAFSQGSAGRATGEGTGLGLFIARSLARLLGGDVTFESELGRGTTFVATVRAPASPPRVTAEPPPRAAAAVDAAELAALPPDLRAALRAALIAGDTEAALAALDPVKSSPLGQRVRRAVETFDFESILEALRHPPPDAD